MAMAQQRMQQNAASAGNLGLVEASSRIPGGAAVPPDNQPHQGSQSGGGIGTHETGNHGQESERSAITESGTGNEQPLQQGPSNVADSSQQALRRNSALNLVASAAGAFDAAKDIMETLRSKHTNLASELEVIYLY